MNIIQTNIPGVLVFEPRVWQDDRGYFLETFRADVFEQAHRSFVFVQDNHSCSVQGVLRGLHFQWQHPQGKLIQVLGGEIFDVAVDIREGSPTYGAWFGCILSEENHHQLFVPPGLAHGFATLSPIAHVLYKCTDYYHAEFDAGIAWNDPDIGIDWPLPAPRLSDKDRHLPRLCDLPPAHRQRLTPSPTV
jgi:dTDP-4-dehydrorhamnose 3,5-epimerase